MIYRPATQKDLPRLLYMVNQAKSFFKANNINQWQKGEPDGPGLAVAIEKAAVHVLEQEGQAAGMITVVPGPEASYARIDGAWLNEEPYAAFHRVCVEESLKGHGIARQLFLHSEEYARNTGWNNIRIDTHPDNCSMQLALAKSGYIFCGRLTLAEGAEKGEPRLAYHKILS